MNCFKLVGANVVIIFDTMQESYDIFLFATHRKPCETKYVDNHLPFSAMRYKFVATNI